MPCDMGHSTRGTGSHLCDGSYECLSKAAILHDVINDWYLLLVKLFGVVNKGGHVTLKYLSILITLLKSKDYLCHGKGERDKKLGRLSSNNAAKVN